MFISLVKEGYKMKGSNKNSEKRKLLELKQKLEDVQLEKKMSFEQRGLHVWSDQVVDQFSEFDREIDFYQKQIQELERNQK